jgi:hypothetical protein
MRGRKKKDMGGIKNIILKSLTGLSLFLFFFSISAMDSENCTPFFIIGGISLAWLGLFYYANRKYFDEEE